MLDALLVVAEAQRLPANACVAVYGKPARESPVMQVLATMKLRVLEFSHPTLVTRAGIQQNMWLNSVLANPSHMDEMDKRTAEFVESVRGSKVSCSFYSGIQARADHVLRQWISWFNEPKTQAFLQHGQGYCPNTGTYAGQPVVILLLELLPDAAAIDATTLQDASLAEKVYLLISVNA